MLHCLRDIREETMVGPVLLTKFHGPDSCAGANIKYYLRILNRCKI